MTGLARWISVQSHVYDAGLRGHIWCTLHQNSGFSAMRNHDRAPPKLRMNGYNILWEQCSVIYSQSLENRVKWAVPRICSIAGYWRSSQLNHISLSELDRTSHMD